jgi:hypothetical protein
MPGHRVIKLSILYIEYSHMWPQVTDVLDRKFFRSPCSIAMHRTDASVRLRLPGQMRTQSALYFSIRMLMQSEVLSTGTFTGTLRSNGR